MSNNEYHGNEAIGSTLLKKIASKSLAHAMSEEFKTSAAMNLGSAVHAAILEPETYEKEFIVSPKIDKRTKAGKEQYKEFLELSFGKILINEDQEQAVIGAVESLKRHNIANGMLTGGESEYSYFAELDGISCKCRPDYFNSNSLIDLKTCADASNDGFMKACINFGYHIQAAFYLDVFNAANGTSVKDFYFVAIETSKPFAINTFKMGEVEINLGREQYKKALKQLKEYRETNNLDNFCYEKKINEIQFPLWALEKFSA
jgi:exodeoxyribonuclease VIII